MINIIAVKKANYDKLKKENVQMQMFKAITPKDFNMMDHLSNYGKFLNVSVRNSHQDGLNKYEISCFLSHLENWKYCVKINKPLWIVEETIAQIYYDLLFQAETDAKIHKFDLLLGYAFDPYDFHTFHKPVFDKKLYEDYKIIKHPFICSAKCYRITPRLAKHLIARTKTGLHFQVDFFMLLNSVYDNFVVAESIKPIIKFQPGSLKHSPITCAKKANIKSTIIGITVFILLFIILLFVLYKIL